MTSRTFALAGSLGGPVFSGRRRNLRCYSRHAINLLRRPMWWTDWQLRMHHQAWTLEQAGFRWVWSGFWWSSVRRQNGWHGCFYKSPQNRLSRYYWWTKIGFYPQLKCTRHNQPSCYKQLEFLLSHFHRGLRVFCCLVLWFLRESLIPHPKRVI